MTSAVWTFVVPALPLLIRLGLCLRFRSLVVRTVPEEANDRSEHRAIVGVLAGFSFTALLGLFALPKEVTIYELPIWFVLISFLSYMAVLNLQGYKSKWWHDQLGDALYETANYGLIASVVALVAASQLSNATFMLASLLGGFVWISDSTTRIVQSAQFFSGSDSAERTAAAKLLERARGAQKEEKQPAKGVQGD